jgi:type IV secretory pathway VirB10-like protein
MDSSPKVSAFQTVRVSYGVRAAPGTVLGSRSGAPASQTGAVADALRDALAPKDPTELQNNQAGKNAFLAGAKLAQEDETNPYLVREAISRFEVTAGVTLSQDDTTNDGFGDNQASRQQIKNTLATALGQNLDDVASEMIRLEMNVQPTLKIRPGYRFNVFVNKDLIFEGPYLNTYVGGGLIP